MDDVPGTALLNVVLPLPIPGPLTYALGPGMEVPPRGARVVVPVGRRNMVGVAMGEVHKAPEGIGLRTVTRVLDNVPLVPECLLELAQWASSYYFYPLGKAISEILPPGLLSARKRGIEKILSGKKGRGVQEPEFLVWENVPEDVVLTEHQKKALSIVSEGLSRRAFLPLLLHGVTGSGKTEVYLQAAHDTLSQGRQVLVMVPEISMTAQTVGRFTSRFGPQVTVLHSGLTEAQRREQWRRVRQGESNLVVGTRSAVFAPLENIGLIVVDEEHDPSYKQESRLRYHARDLAVVRAKYHGAVVLLGSATPSVVTFWNARSGRYRLLEMPERVAKSVLPTVQIVDRREKEKKKKGVTRPLWLSTELREAMEYTLERGEQVLLFLNRRGYANYTFCPECGHVFKCRHCEVSLTYHREKAGRGAGEELVCHYCGFHIPALPICPQCKGQAVRATGYGTERVATELMELFPEIAVGRLDKDTATSSRKLQELLRAFHHREIQVLVGTQMISKGHDFPGLTLVGVLWADLSLNLPEYHAPERTFQLLIQVAGRAGRRGLPGKVIIQTYLPEHYALKCVQANDLQGFYQRELALRRELSYPPFGRLINLRFSGKSKARVVKAAERVASVARAASFRLEEKEKVEVLGPAPAPMSRLKGKFRYQILFKSTSIKPLRQLFSLVSIQAHAVLGSAVRMEVDVDPLSLL